MRIALAQIDCRLGNLPANIATHRAALEAVRDRGGADLAIFPELSLTGYRLRSNIYRAAMDQAQFAQAWQTLSAGLAPETACVLGYVEMTERAILHNTASLLYPDSPQPRLRHRKVYLPTYGMFEEARYTRPGAQFRAVDLQSAAGERWRVGILCCEDAWHPSAWTIMQARGVDLVVVPSASPGRGVEAEQLGSKKSWHGILASMAELTGCWVAYCNRVGFEDDIHFWGGSSLFAPTGEMVCEAALLESDLIVCDLDKRAITRTRTMTPLTADEQWDLTLRELATAVDDMWEE